MVALPHREVKTRLVIVDDRTLINALITRRVDWLEGFHAKGPAQAEVDLRQSCAREQPDLDTNSDTDATCVVARGLGRAGDPTPC